jgi:membrane protein DedA with SNARE-associated domain
VRFAFGARIVLPIACGAARLRIPIFLIGSAIASLVWSAVFVTLGWLFGETALLVLGHIRRYEDELTGLLIAAVVVVAVVLYQRHRPPPLIDQTETTGSGPAITDEGRA